MKVEIDIPGTDTEVILKKIALQKIAQNFDKDNLTKIAEVSQTTNANKKLPNLFNNPFFKMALK